MKNTHPIFINRGAATIPPPNAGDDLLFLKHFGPLGPQIAPTERYLDRKHPDARTSRIRIRLS